MSTDPADAAVRDQLGQQAETVTGQPAAGIFGDPAGASQPGSQALDLGAARAAAPDPDEMLAMLRRQQAQIEAMQAEREAERKAAEPEPAGPPDLTPRLGNASGELQAAVLGLHSRLLRLEEHLFGK